MLKRMTLLRRASHSTLPFREELIDKLQKANFEKSAAEKLVDSIDTTVIES
jgi:hypothetical protein